MKTHIHTIITVILAISLILVVGAYQKVARENTTLRERVATHDAEVLNLKSIVNYLTSQRGNGPTAPTTGVPDYATEPSSGGGTSAPSQGIAEPAVDLPVGRPEPSIDPVDPDIMEVDTVRVSPVMKYAE